MSKYNLTEIFNESFDSLAKKLDKQKGIDKEDAAKIAGSIAAKKMAGAGKGPTAKQKARVKEEEVSDTEQVFDIIYAAGGKDVAPDFLDAIGEEFEIPFEFSRVDEQKEPVSEITSDTRNRIDGMVNQKFLSTFLTSFGEMYADLVQTDPFDSEDVLEFLEGEMRSMLKEKGMYEDNFTPDDMNEDLFSKDGDTEDNVDNIDKVSSPSTKGVGYDQVSKANTAEDDMESKETLNPKPMYEDLKKHFKRFM